MTEPAVEITGQISTNKGRATRAVYTGSCDGRRAIIKAFAHPRRGWLHWRQCDFNARTIRRRNIPAPTILYSGWLERLQSYVIIYEFLEDAGDFRWLRETPDRQALLTGLEQLLELVALMHSRGAAQADTTLGNFMSRGNQVFVIDEDRINIRPWPLGRRASLHNVASLLSQWRLDLDDQEIQRLHAVYSTHRDWPASTRSLELLRKKTAGFSAWRKNKRAYMSRQMLLAALVTAIIVAAIAGVMLM